jgi:hypothetical protein
MPHGSSDPADSIPTPRSNGSDKDYKDDKDNKGDKDRPKDEKVRRLPIYDYDITEGQLSFPKEFRDARILRMFVEFMMHDVQGVDLRRRPNAENYVLFKLDFAEVVEYQKSRFSAAVLSMQLAPVHAGLGVGHLMLAPLKYTGPTFGVARSFGLRVKQHVSIGQVIEAILCKEMQHFRFLPCMGCFLGSRDWV